MNNIKLLDVYDETSMRVLTKQTAGSYLDEWVREYIILLNSDKCTAEEKMFLFGEKLVQLRPIINFLEGIHREFSLEELLGPYYFKGV